MRHLYRCPLRWGDMDAFQHINNVAFLEYLQEARVDMFWGVSSPAGLHSLGTGIVVARHEIDYLAPLNWRVEPILIDIWVSDLRAGSFVIEYQLRDEEVVYAKARTVMVPYDIEAKRSRRLSDEEKAALKPYLEVSA